MTKQTSLKFTKPERGGLWITDCSPFGQNLQLGDPLLVLAWFARQCVTLPVKHREGTRVSERDRELGVDKRSPSKFDKWGRSDLSIARHFRGRQSRFVIEASNPLF